MKLKLQISEIKVADIPDIDLSQVGVVDYGNFSVEVIDPVTDYLKLMEVNGQKYTSELFKACFAFFGRLYLGLLSLPWNPVCRVCSTLTLSNLFSLILNSGKRVKIYLHVCINFPIL